MKFIVGYDGQIRYFFVSESDEYLTADGAVVQNVHFESNICKFGKNWGLSAFLLEFLQV